MRPAYDLSGRLLRARTYTGTNIETQTARSGVDYTYANKTNYITNKTFLLPASGLEWSTAFAYGSLAAGTMPDRVYTVTHSNGLKAAYTYDDLGRRTAEAVTFNGTALFTNTYAYRDGA